MSRRRRRSAKGYVHWGATSQDVIDTGLVLQLRDALALIEADVDRLATALAVQARRHADDGAGRPHVAAAGVAGHAGHQARRRAERAPSSSAATGCSAPPGTGRAVRRRCGHAGVARRSRHCGHRGACREPGTRCARLAVAHAARPVLRRRGDARHADRDARQARARRLAARPVGSRRSARTRAAGPRRIVDDAAEAQSGRCGDRARGGGARARTRIDDADGRRAGARAGARQLACRMGYAAGDRALCVRRARRDGRSGRGPRRRRGPDAREPRHHAGTDLRRGRADGARAERSAAAPHIRSSRAPVGARVRSMRICARFSRRSRT